MPSSFIASSSLAVSPCQYGVITLGEDSAQYRTQAVDVSAWARANGSTDEDLLDFAQYAADFFTATSLHQANPQLHSDPDARAMALWLSELNAAYFSGRLDTVDTQSDYAKRWQEGDAFMGMYVSSILAEPPRNHTQLDFPF